MLLKFLMYLCLWPRSHRLSRSQLATHPSLTQCGCLGPQTPYPKEGFTTVNISCTRDDFPDLGSLISSCTFYTRDIHYSLGRSQAINIWPYWRKKKLRHLGLWLSSLTQQQSHSEGKTEWTPSYPCVVSWLQLSGVLESLVSHHILFPLSIP